MLTDRGRHWLRKLYKSTHIKTHKQDQTAYILKIINHYWLTWSRGLRFITVPNFIKIGQSIAEILRFFIVFSRWRPSAILDLLGEHLDYPRRVLGDLYHCAKFGYDRCSSFNNMSVSIFGTSGWKTPIHAPKIGFIGLSVPQNGLQYQRKPKKAHPCMSPHHLSQA